ncbi:MAG: hypothetical protein Q9183_007142 [Haloplaca sp. 2 TL-2023]
MKLTSNAQMYDSDDNHPSTPVNDVVSQLSAAAAADDMVKVEDASDVEQKPKIEESLFLTDRSESEDESRRRERIAARAALPPTPGTTPNTRQMPRLKFRPISNPLRTSRGLRPTRGVLPTPAATPTLSRKRVRFGTSSPDNDDKNDADYSPTPGANKRACLSTRNIRPNDLENNVVKSIPFKISLAAALAKSKNVNGHASKPDSAANKAIENVSVPVSSPASTTATTLTPGTLKKAKPLRPHAQPTMNKSLLPLPAPLSISPFELVRLHESLWEQIDWKKVNQHVACNRGAKTYEKVVSRMMDGWMEVLESQVQEEM